MAAAANTAPEGELANLSISDSKKKKAAEAKKKKAEKAPKGNARKDNNKNAQSKSFSDDPEAMFKFGFLADVAKEHPLSKETERHIRTRFPPEPNGFLHIGHSKAIAVNFGFAKYHGGECYLRFDDTNPEGEEERFYRSIEDIVRWLGFTPARITNASDNFDRLYELAENLIKKGGAYICHCTKAEIKAQRGDVEGGGKGGKRYPCKHRERPIEESLDEFRAMRNGKYEPGEAALRMKQNLEDGNPQMWDIFAYRILDKETAHHYRTGDKWRVYPTYDFAHCLCDSEEGISHSLCTTEFELSRVSYEWLCDKLEVYKPMQREYGRLNVTGTVLSKRKIIDLIKNGHVRAWDDPRLYTLIALRRRGVPPGAILSFINELGVTKAKTNIQVSRFEQHVRKYLEMTVPRLMVVLDPVVVIIENLPDDHMEMVELPFSKNPEHGVHSVPFTKTVFIDRSDFREIDSPDYFRLAPGKTVGLMKVPFPITATSFEKDENTGKVTRILARYERPEDGAAPKKAKTYIHWIAESPQHKSPVKAEVRIFNQLFKSDDPQAHPEGFLADINPKSEETFPNALAEVGFDEIYKRAPWPAEGGEMVASGEKTAPETVRFQGMRVAYFTVDKDSDDGKVILNRIVSLKEDAAKSN